MQKRYAAVEVEGLSKTFHIPRQHVTTIKERALHPVRRVEMDVLRAIRDVSFQVEQGEFFGIVGRNGSGKSTLLKCLAGIYAADQGRIDIAGRLVPLIELGVGFEPDLVAYDNVIMNGVMMGLSAREAKARFDDVIAFAELEDFLDLKLKNYSSGMQVRLGFSLMLQADADILLVDEVLAVGDASFQEKCFEAFRRLRNEGRTIIFVSHAMDAVERFCHRAMLLSHGEMVAMGDPSVVARKYLELNFAHAAESSGSRSGAIERVWVTRPDGEVIEVLQHGEPIEIHAVVLANEDVEAPEVHLAIRSVEGARVFVATTRGSGDGALLAAGERAHAVVRLENPLTDGRYFIDCSLHHERVDQPIASRVNATDVLVKGARPHAGLIDVPHVAELDRAESPVEVGP
jgi:ABC-type polysaccharide/polyol phosphate transport system ATPase subunit